MCPSTPHDKTESYFGLSCRRIWCPPRPGVYHDTDASSGNRHGKCVDCRVTEGMVVPGLTSRRALAPRLLEALSVGFPHLVVKGTADPSQTDPGVVTSGMREHEGVPYINLRYDPFHGRRRRRLRVAHASHTGRLLSVNRYLPSLDERCSVSRRLPTTHDARRRLRDKMTLMLKEHERIHMQSYSKVGRDYTCASLSWTGIAWLPQH